MSVNELEVVNPIRDEADSRSVINLVPTYFSTRLKSVPEAFFDMDEKELIKAGNIGENERKLRIAFWLEYERAQRTGTSMQMTNVFRGIVHQSAFMRTIVSNTYKIAYICSPLEDYRISLEDSLRLAIEREKEILTMPIKTIRTTEKNGVIKTVEFVDTNLALVQHKIRESIQNRLQGMPVHRSMQINETRNVTATSSILDTGAFDATPEALGKMTEQELRGFIKKLKNEKADSASEPLEEIAASDDTIDVTPTATEGDSGLNG